MKTTRIALTACGNYQFYHNWFVNEPGIELVKLDYDLKNLEEIKSCDGIVFTGGQDIHPRYYRKLISDIPNATAIDENRDAFEWALLECIAANPIPTLGICRGLQIINVFYGGTLIPDIPSAGKNNHSKLNEREDRYHPVMVIPGSRLNKIAGVLGGEINSAHHQGIATIGRDLQPVAFSDDGIIEALEPITPERNAYLMLVQWHPERMTDQESPFSSAIKNDFLQAARTAQNDHK